jgi:ribosome-binding protein aMBF1 (putative translation factor)|tara:strand:- start:64 stop:414 length:351 start_codon:yes stop_codon:yes gene_type:complete
MEHQDWENYIIHCKDGKNTMKDGQDKTPEVQKKNTGVLQKDTKLEKKIEEGKLKHQKIDPELSKKIQQGRLSKGLTQKQLANQLSIPVTEINEMENGKFPYNGQKISKVKRILSIK